MKRTLIALCLLIFLLVITLPGCASPDAKLEDAMSGYSQMVQGEPPENLRLTIYYMDPSILTRAPLTTDDLVNASFANKIVVESNELAAHWELLRKMDPSVLQPVKEKSHINARLYYVFEVGDSCKLLEVVISSAYSSVFVNGVEVENDPVFYELVSPFLTEEAHDLLGI